MEKIKAGFFRYVKDETRELWQTEKEGVLLFLFLVFLETALYLACRNRDDSINIGIVFAAVKALVFIIIAVRQPRFVCLIWATIFAIMTPLYLRYFHWLLWSL
jgi:Kef-type K+ transport system membrane component KefB